MRALYKITVLVGKKVVHTMNHNEQLCMTGTGSWGIYKDCGDECICGSEATPKAKLLIKFMTSKKLE